MPRRKKGSVLQVEEVEGDDDFDGNIKEEGQGKKKKKNRTKKGRDNTRLQFEFDDGTDIGVLKEGMSSVLKGLEMCAETCLKGLEGNENKKERMGALKEFHNASIAVVETKLKLEGYADAVQAAYEMLDMEAVAGEEEDDEQFLALLQEFEQNAMEEIEKRGKEVTMEVVDRDPEYQKCLEVLNSFVQKRAKPLLGKEGESSFEGFERFGDEERCTEGLEALTDYVPTHDPITKKLFTKPLVNRKCGHVYENDTVISYLVSGVVRCPYAGCNVKFKYDDLEENEEMTRRILEKIEADGGV